MRGVPVTVVGTYRSDELHRDHPLRPLLASLERIRTVQRLELARFRSGGFKTPSGGLTMVTQQAQSVVREMGYLSDANAELNAL